MKRSLSGLLTLLLTLWAGMAVSAPADKRVALVIGNAAYDSFGRLTNPGNDAEDLASVLRKVGFEVIDGRDLSRREMDRKLAQFSRLATDADTALVYYAGHGLQYQSQNYLVPVDAQLRDGFDVPFETISVEFVISALDNAKGARILILDACRDLPLKDVGNSAGSHGLARAVGRKGLIMAYATQADNVAFDGTGRNSFFAGALLKAMQEPGLEIGQVFQQVAATVSGATNGRQLPEVTRSYPGEVFLNRDETDLQAWTRLRRSNQLADLRRFVEKYPHSMLVDDALTRIQLLESQAKAPAPTDRNEQQGGTPGASWARLEDENRQREQALAGPEKARREEENRLAELARKAREDEARRQEQARLEAARQEAVRQEAARQEAARREQAARQEQAARLAAEAAKRAEETQRAEEAAKAQQTAKLDAQTSEPAKVGPAKAPEGQTVVAMLPTPEAAKPAAAQPTYASLPPKDEAAEEIKTAALAAPPVNQDTVVRAVQQRLTELGCYSDKPGANKLDPSKLEPSWGKQSSDALEKFYRFSQAGDPSKTRAVKIVSHMPDQATLDALNGYSGRICPISCPTGTEPKGDVCIKITCPTGMDLDGDECRPRHKPIQAHLPAETIKKAPAREKEIKAKTAVRPEVRPEPAPVHKAVKAPVRETPRPVRAASRPVEVERPVKPKVKVVEPIRVRAPVPALARSPRSYAPAPAAASAAPSYTPAEIGASRLMSRMP